MLVNIRQRGDRGQNVMCRAAATLVRQLRVGCTNGGETQNDKKMYSGPGGAALRK